MLKRNVRLAWLCALIAPGLVWAAPAQEPRAEPVPYRLILPPEIPAVVGVEANVYFDNVVLTRRIHELVFDVACARGAQQRERWTFTPAGKDVGRHRLVLSLCNEEMQVIAAATTTVRVVAAEAGAGRQVSCLIIGDSLTAATHYPRRVRELFAMPSNPSLSMIGTAPARGGGDGTTHEGYGGWTCQRFVTYATPNPAFAADKTQEPFVQYSGGRRRTSPFIFLRDGKPVFDFPRYIKEQAEGRGPDFVTIALGCNDTFSATEETIEERIDSMFGYLDTLIAGIRAARADTKIGIVSLVPPAGAQDAFGRNYRCGQTRWQYRRNQHRVLERTVAKYGGLEERHIYIIPAYVNLDTMRGYPTRTAPPFPHAGSKVVRLSNGVHPAKSGYYQMGDSIYCWMKALLAE